MLHTWNIILDFLCDTFNPCVVSAQYCDSHASGLAVDRALIPVTTLSRDSWGGNSVQKVWSFGVWGHGHSTVPTVYGSHDTVVTNTVYVFICWKLCDRAAVILCIYSSKDNLHT
jgi:hypothetical protein